MTIWIVEWFVNGKWVPDFSSTYFTPEGANAAMQLQAIRDTTPRQRRIVEYERKETK